jgi:hypothetical protein
MAEVSLGRFQAMDEVRHAGRGNLPGGRDVVYA